MSHITRRSFVASAIAAPLAATLAKPLFAADEVTKLDLPKFKLGLVSYRTAANWDLKTTLDICKRVGIAALECRTTHKHDVEPKLSADQRNDVKQQFADSGVVFWGCGTICEFHSPDASVVKKNIETCKEFIKLVSDIGGIGVKVRPNGIANGYTVEQACEQIGKALAECGKAAADAGVIVSVEVHGSDKRIMFPENIKAIMDICGQKSVGITWNSEPTDIKDGSVAEAVKLLAPYLRSCHIHELDDTRKDVQYPYRDLFQNLKKIGYDRYTMIEAEKESTDPKQGEEFLRKYKAKWTELTTG